MIEPKIGLRVKFNGNCGTVIGFDNQIVRTQWDGWHNACGDSRSWWMTNVTLENPLAQQENIQNKYDSQTCITCVQYFPMAAPNIPDNRFKCWSCRNS